MITYEQAIDENNRYFVSLDEKWKNGSPITLRRNGKTKVWKTRPGEFRIPVKYGLKGTGYITHLNASAFVLK